MCSNYPEATDPAEECLGEATCDGSGVCLYGAHLWSKKLGGIDDDRLRDVAVDGQGNVVVAGSFAGSVNFGGGTLTTISGSTDAVVAKFDAAGTHIWSKRFGDGATQIAQAVGVDASGNVFVAGVFDGAINLGGLNLANADIGEDIFVAKFSAAGAHLWSKGFAVAGTQPFTSYSGVHDLAVDGFGNVIFTGHTWSDVNFGGGVLMVSGATDAYIAKLTSSGVHAWSELGAGAGTQYGYALATFSNHDVAWAGIFDNSMNLGGGTMTASGLDVFFARFSSSGAHLWSTRFGDDSAVPRSLAVDPTDRVAMSGSFQTSIDFGGGSKLAAGGDDGFIALFSGTGVHQWSKTFGSAADDEVTHVLLGVDNVIATGFTSGSVDLGGGTLTSAGSNDLFVGKFTPSGAHVWSKIFGGSGNQTPDGFGFGVGDNVVIGGTFDGTFDFGGPNLVSGGGDDMFLASLGP